MTAPQFNERKSAERFLTAADALCTWCFCLSLALIIFLTALNTFGFAVSRLLVGGLETSRFLASLAGGLPGYEELVAQLSGVAVAAAMIGATAQRAHVAVTSIPLPDWLARVLDRFGLLLISMIMVTLSWFLILGSLKALHTLDTTPVLALPTWPFIGVAAFLCGLASLVAILIAGKKHG